MTSNLYIRDPNYVRDRILDRLGYTPNAGWIDASEFANLTTHRFAMLQATQDMSVLGAFCLKSSCSRTQPVVTPLVYVARAEDSKNAEEIHRRIWSQGLVPFAIIVIPEHVIVCPGFSYTRKNWTSNTHWFDRKDIESLPSDVAAAVPINHSAAAIWDLRAVRLRTSLFWREHEVEVDRRIDRRLLSNLDGLSRMLIEGKGVSSALSPTAANGLIGRFLYVFFLVDRGIIDQDWVYSRGHSRIDLDDQYADWPAEDTWSFLDDLDSIFNGSIFPLTADDRLQMNGSHINLVRRVMKHGAQPLGKDGIQLSFLDIYYGVLRTETLSVVYEQFLENMKPGERRRSGAFFTPPFLVDFMLDRIEEILPLKDGTTILDPSAGSGVFLVAAYRRLVEKWLVRSGYQSVPVDVLRNLLLNNIFGIERNKAACHVAAFSLYLTMLDYANPRDLARISGGGDPETLFPDLVERNLGATDFFCENPGATLVTERVDCVVGNPPWQKLDVLGSTHAEEWRNRHGAAAPIGRGQAAELFAWKAIREHVNENGVLGLLLPAKTFVNATSWKFRQSLGVECTFVGVANFSHFRHRLFSGAKQAAAAVFLKNEPPSVRTKTWICSPLSIGQPLARGGFPWTFIFDRSDLQYFRQGRLSETKRRWFEALALRPVDRHIRAFLEDSANSGKTSMLGDLCNSVGTVIRRGGNPSETGVGQDRLLTAIGGAKRPLDLFGGGTGYAMGLQVRPGGLPFSSSGYGTIATAYRNRFSGNVLLIARSFKEIEFFEQPVQITSNILSISFTKDACEVTPRERQFLRAIGAYLRSSMCQYLVATTGRRWLMDRRNVEPGDLAEFPVPFVGLDDQRIGEAVSAEREQQNGMYRRMLGLSSDFGEAIDEFLSFRVELQDGDVPDQALKAPTVETIRKYKESLRTNLNLLAGADGVFSVESQSDRELGVGAVVVHFNEDSDEDRSPEDSDRLCRSAIQRFHETEANAFSSSLSIVVEDWANSASLVKPLEYFRWTLEGAFSDSRKLMNAFMTGAR